MAGASESIWTALNLSQDQSAREWADPKEEKRAEGVNALVLIGRCRIDAHGLQRWVIFSWTFNDARRPVLLTEYSGHQHLGSGGDHNVQRSLQAPQRLQQQRP